MSYCGTMLVLSALFGLLLLGAWIYCLLDAATSPATEVRLLPKWLWVAFIALPTPLGAMCWLMFGRPVAARDDDDDYEPVWAEEDTWSEATRNPRVVGPDDDPEFLAELARRTRRLRDDET
jgi:Phospholipase_D-nuclease N-terminal